MNRSTLLILLIFTLLMTACGANTPNATGPASGVSGNPTGGELSPSVQVAIGTLKLDETENAVTVEQAQELLPLWETLQVLSESDTAAQQEKDALVEQIQETLTAEQRQAITDMNLTREDMQSILQEQGLATGGGPEGGQNNNFTGGNQNGGGGFGPGGFPGGVPPQGGFPGGGPGGGGGQGTGLTPDQIATLQASRQQTGGSVIPPTLINALIEYLQEKVGA
ncbi:MAG TPA: hypothetical protein VFR47_16330 [Anaerolineales bacterium]|nr:hypothetical protein [Anaerolineales bacterium]